MLEYLIVRNQQVPRLFNVVAVHFERETGTVIKEAIPYEEAVDVVEYYNSKNGEQ